MIQILFAKVCFTSWFWIDTKVIHNILWRIRKEWSLEELNIPIPVQFMFEPVQFYVLQPRLLSFSKKFTLRDASLEGCHLIIQIFVHAFRKHSLENILWVCIYMYILDYSTRVMRSRRSLLLIAKKMPSTLYTDPSVCLLPGSTI